MSAGMVSLVVMKQSMSTPMQSMKPIWLSTGVVDASSAPNARNMMMPAAEMMVPAWSSAAITASRPSLPSCQFSMTESIKKMS